ncbi:MAG: DNA-3-methyladenine glycosylase I [Gemmatimonadetes bacterium]|nr:DNA-3-methyladenine glycosylase I [Gemmatimonadota bacterium]
MIRRCWPAIDADPAMLAYHDREWGVPVHDDRKLNEFMVLDAFQAGLSWAIVLKKREAFRDAFDNFEPDRMARFTPARIQRLVKNPGIIRNRLKIAASVTNARAFLDIQEEVGSFDAFIWQFVGGRTRHNRWKTLQQLPARSRESDRMSEALYGRGFKFVGSTICYAFMQAAGMVNDHLVGCYRHAELGGSRGR